MSDIDDDQRTGLTEEYEQSKLVDANVMPQKGRGVTRSSASKVASSTFLESYDNDAPKRVSPFVGITNLDILYLTYSHRSLLVYVYTDSRSSLCLLS